MDVTTARTLSPKLAIVLLIVAAGWSIVMIPAAVHARHHVKREMAWVKKALKVPGHKHANVSGEVSAQRA